jgi:hypothetical protein
MGFPPRGCPVFYAGVGRLDLTAAGSAHTKGSYLDAFTATERETTWLAVYLASNNINRDFMVDVAIDPSGGTDRTIIIPDLFFSALPAGTTVILGYAPYVFPVRIPGGSRVSARCQCTTAGGVVFARIMLGGGPLYPSGPLSSLSAYGAGLKGNVTAYGTVPASTALTSVDPGGSANVKGSWVSLGTIQETTREILVARGNDLNTVRTSATWALDIGLGGSGSQRVVIPDMAFEALSGNDLVFPDAHRFPAILPAGETLWARSQCDITDATDRLFDVGVYAIS